MPLCKIQQREFTCYQEHLDNCDDPVMGCVPRAHFKMPPDCRLYSLNHPKLQSFEPISIEGPEMDDEEEAPVVLMTENGVDPGEKEPTAGRSAIKRKINSAAEAPAEVVTVTATTVMNKNSLRHSKRSKTNNK